MNFIAHWWKTRYIQPPAFPYTLDHKIFHDCMIPPCPTKVNILSRSYVQGVRKSLSKSQSKSLAKRSPSCRRSPGSGSCLWWCGTTTATADVPWLMPAVILLTLRYMLILLISTMTKMNMMDVDNPCSNPLGAEVPGKSKNLRYPSKVKIWGTCEQKSSGHGLT